MAIIDTKDLLQFVQRHIRRVCPGITWGELASYIQTHRKIGLLDICCNTHENPPVWFLGIRWADLVDAGLSVKEVHIVDAFQKKDKSLK